MSQSTGGQVSAEAAYVHCGLPRTVIEGRYVVVVSIQHAIKHRRDQHDVQYSNICCLSAHSWNIRML